ncbi:hypothetical protein K443DRAFT_683598 [Laccaria amethystina LaAM-08-1]|jgi:hypothetical protein|uniref:Uncharacterized protein n=1 Tax=Laccaria amethystina LaAM-08-1 TaxID=1095629 RepID=A0A0C9XEQ0_9AGAR|nr:hypothetical protein K443DRAFT_683598 [Laccaria amethystina LaAM-08-1]
MLEDVAPPPREQLRTSYDVHATGFPPDPRRSQFAVVGLYTPVFGSKQRCWALHVGIRVVHASVNVGVGLMPVLGSKQRCWAIRAGVGSYHWHWVRDVEERERG